jgi:CheY-like chemotaxis protein
MPNLDGYDAARRIRQEPWGRDVLMIATTGWGQDEDRRRSNEAGFDHHLVKPVDLTQLQSLISAPL